MRSDELSKAQVKWINEQVGDACRAMARIKSRMVMQEFPTDDPFLVSLSNVVASLFDACSVTAKRLRKLEPPVTEEILRLGPAPRKNKSDPGR
jgi:hypothetical protein